MVLSSGDWTYLFSSWIAVGFWVLAVAGFVMPVFLRGKLKKPQRVTD